MRQKFQLLIYLSTFILTAHSASIEQIQQLNLEILTDSLGRGWRAFCEAPVNEGVMSLFDGINPSDTSLHVLTCTNQSVELPIRSLSELKDYDINPQRKTLLYVNAFFAPDSYFSAQSHLLMLQMRRRDLNIIIMNVVKNIQQLYYAVRHHLTLQAYFVAKILKVLTENGIKTQDITIVGHSVGANVAALGISYFLEEYIQKHEKVSVIGQFIGIDPSSYICDTNDLYIHRNLSDRVVIIHGEGNVLGVRQPMGTIDIFPNGIGYFPKRRLQPGCDTSICSHMYPFLLFMEVLMEEVRLPAVQCKSWLLFREEKCDYENTVDIGLSYPHTAAGVYFCLTQPYPPFTLMEEGLRHLKRSKKKSSM